jgi:rubredoxin
VVVHFIVIDGDEIRPLCGSWAGSPNWSRLPAAVTCPRCRELLEVKLLEVKPQA